MQVQRLYGRKVDGAFPVRGLLVIREKKRTNFSLRFVEQGLREGWLTIGAGRMVVKGKPDIHYRVLRGPGYYCCHDDRYFEDGGTARAYTETMYAGIPSPDTSNPHGYRYDRHYACELAVTKPKSAGAGSS